MANEVVGVRDRVNRRQQLPEEVAGYIRELIISGQVQPGEFLRMERIAEQVGVSNTPVREGLLALKSEGFVQLVPRRGFVVAPFTQQDVRDLFWAQAQLARELAARAAKKITPEQVARLEANVEELQKAVAAGDTERIADLGHAFHRQINLAADSTGWPCSSARWSTTCRTGSTPRSRPRWPRPGTSTLSWCRPCASTTRARRGR